ncbi:MAG: MATE family efflux transporter [Clostridia bacterium]|nr:MATE family efflux transporter [Clostridia bacterium]
MSSKFGKDLTVGSIPRHLLTFSLPMLIGNLLQTGYSLVNAIWIGRKVSEDALGAASISFPIVFILIALSSGATMATTILVSQYYGAKDYKTVEKVVNNSFSIALILGTVLTIAGIFSSDVLLKLMKTPEQQFAMASSYLKITIAGFLLMYIGFLITSILRGIGDTVTPLIFTGIGVGINAVLDPLFIMGVGPLPELGLNGAAYASLVAQALATIGGIIYLNTRNHLVAFNPKNLRMDKHTTSLIFKIGFPSIIQQSLISIGSAAITTCVNTFGPHANNAFGVGTRVDQIAFMPALSMSMATAALTGQNIGAKKPERVKDIFKWGIIMTSVVTIIVSIIVVSFPEFILSIFGLGKSRESIDIGVEYLRINGSAYILFAIMFVSNGIINGAGHTITTMIFSLLSLWVVRVPFAWLLSGTALGTRGIWISMITSFGVTMVISLWYYFSGRWKKEVVRMRGPVPDSEPQI